MNREELRIKLLKFIDNFSYVIPDLKLHEEMVDLALNSSLNNDLDDVETYQKQSLSSLKKLIKGRINELYSKDRESLFKSSFKKIASSDYSEVEKIKMLSILIGSINEEIDLDFYRKIVRNNKYLSDILSPFFIDIDDNIYENDELKEAFPKLMRLYSAYVKEKNISFCVDVLDPSDERRILSRDEIKNLYKRIKLGDNDAKEQLIIHNMRLVKKIAYRYMFSGVDYEDLVQEGVIGLNTAIDRFDSEKDFAFSTYATHWIRQAIRRYVDDYSRVIRIPVHKREWIYKISQKLKEIELKFGGNLSNEEIAEKLGISLNQFQEYLDLNQNVGSLNSIVEGRGGDKDTEIGDFVADPTDSYDALLNDMSNEALKEILKEILDPRAYRIMLLRTGLLDGRIYTLEEIGAEFGVTRERIRQLEVKACKKLGKHPYFKSLNNMDKPQQVHISKRDKIGDVKFKSFKDLLNDRYDDSTQDLIMRLLNDSEIELLRSRYGANLDEFIELDDKNVIQEIRDLIYKVIPERLQSTNLEVSEKIDDVSISSLIDEKSPLISRLSKKFSSEEINYIINTITEKDLSLLKEAFGEQLTANMYDDRINSSIGYLFSVTFQKRVNDARKNFDDATLKVRSLKEILSCECSLERVEQVLKSLTPNERRLLSKRYGGINFDKVYEVDDINTIAKINTLVNEIVLEEVSRRNLMLGRKTFLDLLSHSYSVDDIAKVLKLLSDDDKELLQTRYGTDFNQLIAKKSFKDTDDISKIVLVKVPRLLGKEMKIKEPNIDKYNVRGLTLYEKLVSCKYNENEIRHVLSSLTDEEKNTLALYYGMSLQERATDLDLGMDALEIFTKVIPQSVSLFNSKDARKTKKRSFNDRLKEKYNEEEIKYIFNILNESQLQLLRLSYGDRLDEVVCGVDSGVQQKINILINSTLKRAIDDSREKNNGELKVESFKEILREKYCDEQIDAIIDLLPLEKKDLLIRRFGEDLDKVFDLDDLSDIARVNSLVLDIFKNNFSKRELDKKSKSFMEILKENYSSSELSYIISSLTLEEIELLKVRYGESLDSLIPISSKDTRNEIYSFIRTVIPKRVEEFRSSNMEEKKTKVKRGKMREPFVSRLKEKYNDDEIKYILENLSESERRDLTLRYGESFDQYFAVDDKKTLKRIDALIYALIPKRIEKYRNPSNRLYERLLRYYSKEEIECIFAYITLDELSLLQRGYGNDLNRGDICFDHSLNCKLYRLIKTDFKKKIDSIRNENAGNLKKCSLIETLSRNLSDEEIKLFFESLSGEERELLISRYGKQFNEFISISDISIVARINSFVQSKLLDVKNNKDKKSSKLNVSLINRLKAKYTDEEIKYVLDNLSDSEKELLILRYGENFDQYKNIDDKKLRIRINNFVNKTIFNRVEKRRNPSKKPGGRKTFSLHKRLLAYYNDEEIEYIFSNINLEELSLLQKAYGDDLNSTDIKITNVLRNKIYRLISLDFKNKIDSIRQENNGDLRTYNLLEILRNNSFSEAEISSFIDRLSNEERALLISRYGESFDEVVPISDIRVVARINSFIESRVSEEKKYNLNASKSKSRIRPSFIDRLKKEYSDEEIKYILDNLRESEIRDLKLRFGENFDQYFPVSDAKVINRLGSLIRGTIPKRVKDYRNPPIKKEKKSLSLSKRLSKYYSKEEIECIFSYINQEELSLLQKVYGDDLKNDDVLIDKDLVKGTYRLIKDGFKKKLEFIKQENDGVLKVSSLMDNLRNKFNEEQISLFFERLSSEERELLISRYGESFDEIIPISDIRVVAKVNSLIEKRLYGNYSNKRRKPLIERLQEKYSDLQIKEILDFLTEEQLELLRSRYGENLDEFYMIEDNKQAVKIHNLTTKIISGKYSLRKVPVSVSAVGIKSDSKETKKRKISNFKVFDVPTRFTIRKKKIAPLANIPSSVLIPSPEELAKLNNTFESLVQNNDYEVSCGLLNIEDKLLELKDNLGLLLKKIGIEKDIIGKVKAKKKE